MQFNSGHPNCSSRTLDSRVSEQKEECRNAHAESNFLVLQFGYPEPNPHLPYDIFFFWW